MKYEMPALTEEQREELISDTEDVLKIMRPGGNGYLRAQIAMASLMSEPALWSYWFDAQLKYQEAKFGRPKVKNGKHVNETFYTSPQVKSVNVIECPSFDEYAPHVAKKLRDSFKSAIRAAGYEVKE